MSDGAATRPPGWYPDPDHGAQERLWDGERWTEITRSPTVMVQAPRNGFGPLSLALGVVGVLFGVFPAAFFVAATLGVAGFVLGRVGHRRCVLGQATNGRVAMLGSVVSGAAVVLAVIGAVKVLSG